MSGTEPRVNFYLHSTRPEAVAGRSVINEWYASFPDSNGRFQRRLSSTEDADHEGALDELFIHQRLAQNARVSYEEGGRGPDFRLYRDSAYIASVEMISLFMRHDWQAEQARHDRIADELNRRLEVGRWGLHFEIVRLDRSPPVGRLAAWVKQTTDNLPAYDPSKLESFSPPQKSFIADGVHLLFAFTPRTAVKPGDRIVGSGPVVGGFINSRIRLRTALRGKAGKRYNLRDSSFGICVGIHDPFCDLDDIEEALYGSEGVAIPSLIPVRSGDGFFGRNKQYPNGKNRRISCIFVLNHWNPWRLTEATMLQLDNPFAEHSFPLDLLPVDYHFTTANQSGTTMALGWVPHRPGDSP